MLQDGTKSWEEKKKDAKAAAENAQGEIASAWAMIAGSKISGAEQLLREASKLAASSLKATQQFRLAKDAVTKAERYAWRGDHGQAIAQYRNAIKAATHCTDYVVEAKREGALIASDQKSKDRTVRLTARRVVLAAIAIAIMLASFGFNVYQWVTKTQ